MEENFEDQLVEYELAKDNEFIDYSRKKLEINNLLVGEFSVDGKYEISEAFLKELIAVNKVICEFFNDRYILESKNLIPDLSLKFSLTITKEDASCKATLSLLENVIDNFDVAYTKATVVAKYKDFNDAFFMLKVKKVFNIFTKDESTGKDIMDENLCPYIAGRRKNLLEQKKLFDAKSESLDEEFVKEMLEALSKCGKYGAFAIAKFKKLLEAKGAGFNLQSKGYYKILAMLLQKSIEESGVAKLGYKQCAELKSVLAKRNARLLEACDTTIAVKEEKVDAPAKSAKKPGSKKSSGGKKSGGSGGKSGGDKAPAKSAKKPGKKIFPYDVKTAEKTEDIKTKHNIKEIRSANTKEDNSSVTDERIDINAVLNNSLNTLIGLKIKEGERILQQMNESEKQKKDTTKKNVQSENELTQ